MKTNHEWTRINTNSPEDRRTCFNHKRRQHASAIWCPWCDPVMGGSPPGSAGVPPAQILPQLRPSPPPESTGSGALPLLQPGPCGSRRQGGRLQHRRETERQPKEQHAGGTPALPSSQGGVKAGLSPLGNEPGARPRSFEEKRLIVNEDEPRMDTTQMRRQRASTTGACFCNLVPLVCCHGRKPTRERGRPARTNPPAASAISSTGINRQRRPASASAGPMRFPPAGRSAATSQGN